MNSKLYLAIAMTAMAIALAPQAVHASAPLDGAGKLLARCNALATMRLPHTKIVSAAIVPAKATTWTAAGEDTGHRSFCRVVARVQSSSESDIGVELWLPLEGWVGIFHGNGSGGFAGTFTTGYSGMVDGLRRGFATATTDAGTTPASPLEGDALIGKPRKWRDWARLSTNVMTVTGKAITKAFYGREAKRSYYTGCSSGGQQGLIEALHYPADYDAILVGAPVMNRTWGHAAVLWDYMAAHRTPASRLSEGKLNLLHKTAIAHCWRQGHGIAGDAFISDPLSCKFDPGVLQCKGSDKTNCLTSDEVATARAFYSGPTKSDGSPAYYGWLPGSEMPGIFGWSFLQTPINNEPPFSSLFKWVLGKDWDWKNFDFERDMPTVQNSLDPIVNDATRGDLSAFAARGGKLIIYHGLADTLVAPAQSVSFYERQAQHFGGYDKLARNARLFLAPGVMHCGGGTGPDSFNATLGIPPRPPSDDARHDIFTALIEWTEKDEAPEQIIATKFSKDGSNEIDMQRPICSYPLQPVYRGIGSTHTASNFQCAASGR